LVYLFILLGLAVVIAPLLSAMPSKGQRRKAAVRDQARQYGLRVSVRPPPEIPPRFRFATDTELVCYEKLLSKTLQLAGREVRFVRIGGVWQSILDEPTTPDWVLQLPDGVLVAELFERNVSIFWDERSGLEGLDQLNQAIESIG
jgi:hypothetical protein